MVDGDENSRFFHGFVNNRNKKNHLHGLTINGTWTGEPNEVKQEAFNFFSQKFKERWPNRPKLRSNDFSSISQADQNFQEAPFTISEVKATIWACGNEKAPGPNGFTFDFLKKFWETLKTDIFVFVKFFEKWGRFSRGCNSSFITLVAKVKDPLNLSEYRPISLIGSMYKIIAKLLAMRLK